MLFAAALFTAHAAKPAPLPEKGVIFHLSHGQEAPHHVVHPLVRAAKMSKGDMGVLVYLDVDAAPLVFTDAPSVTFKDHDSTALLAQVIENGGTVAICGQCTAAHGKTTKDLVSGVVIAEPELFFSVGEKIVTFDY